MTPFASDRMFDLNSNNKTAHLAKLPEHASLSRGLALEFRPALPGGRPSIEPARTGRYTVQMHELRYRGTAQFAQKHTCNADSPNEGGAVERPGAAAETGHSDLLIASTSEAPASGCDKFEKPNAQKF